MNEHFKNLIGQQQAIDLLMQAVLKNRIAPAYLFVGCDGVGRSLAARYFSALLLCREKQKTESLKQVFQRIKQGNHPDLLWVEPTYLHQGKRLSPKEATEAGLKRKAPPQIRLEQIRELGQFLSRPPLESERLVVVLEQAETMAEGAANGLLKTLEEPGKATLILMAPDLDSLLPTLISRCAKVPFHRLSKTDLEQVLKQQGYGEILSHPEVLAMAQGSPGQAITYWQQLQSLPHDLLERAKKQPRSLEDALDLAREISKNLDSESQLWLIDYLQHSYWQQQQNSGLINPKILKQLEQARQYLLNYAQPRLVWECTLMALC